VLDYGKRRVRADPANGFGGAQFAFQAGATTANMQFPSATGIILPGRRLGRSQRLRRDHGGNWLGSFTLPSTPPDPFTHGIDPY